MGFGNPRLSVTLTNLIMTLLGIGLAVTKTGWLRWIGIVVILTFFCAGLIMGSWSQLLPGGRKIGHRDGP